MRITIESTDHVVELLGLPCRAWKGTSENGIDVVAFVANVAIVDDDVNVNAGEFEADLEDAIPPTGVEGANAYAVLEQLLER